MDGPLQYKARVCVRVRGIIGTVRPCLKNRQIDLFGQMVILQDICYLNDIIVDSGTILSGVLLKLRLQPCIADDLKSIAVFILTPLNNDSGTIGTDSFHGIADLVNGIQDPIDGSVVVYAIHRQVCELRDRRLSFLDRHYLSGYGVKSRNGIRGIFRVGVHFLFHLFQLESSGPGIHGAAEIAPVLLNWNIKELAVDNILFKVIVRRLTGGI